MNPVVLAVILVIFEILSIIEHLERYYLRLFVVGTDIQESLLDNALHGVPLLKNSFHFSSSPSPRAPSLLSKISSQTESLFYLFTSFFISFCRENKHIAIFSSLISSHFCLYAMSNPFYRGEISSKVWVINNLRLHIGFLLLVHSRTEVLFYIEVYRSQRLLSWTIRCFHVRAKFNSFLAVTGF